MTRYSDLRFAFKFLSYYLTSSNGKGHGIHSPFVFDFITKVLNDKTAYDDYEKVENLRQRLLHDRTVLNVEDYGAGSSSSRSGTRSVASITRHAVKSEKYGQLLYRAVKNTQPKTIIELGTSLGLTTSYLALANPRANVLTLEGSGEIASVARENFKALQLENIRLVEGNFDYTLPALLYNLPTIDFAFIDGNHRREPTLHYFHQLFGKRNNESVIIMDDIHWSSEMEQAWHTIRQYPIVRCTIDLFFFGIILFRHEFKEKQHFTIRF